MNSVSQNVKAIICDVKRFGFHPVGIMNRESLMSPLLSLNHSRHLRSHITGQYTNIPHPSFEETSQFYKFKGGCSWNKVFLIHGQKS